MLNGAKHSEGNDSMNEWMTQALQQARQAAQAGEVPVGAVLVRDGQVIAAAHNRREATHDPTAHAELLCLRQASASLGDWRMRDCTLYVTLEPCPMCAGALLMAQVGRVEFAAPDPEKGCCGSVYDLVGDPALSGRTRWTQGEGAQEARQLLEEFFRRRREGASSASLL